jgi:hypothetical protein
VTTTSDDLDLLGLTDIARLLDVAPATPKTWRYRGLLPEPYATVAGRPVWQRQQILDWHAARKT